MKRLEKFLRPYRRESILAPLFKLLEVVFDLMVPVVVAQIIDVGVAKNDRGYIVEMFFVLLLMAAVGLLCSFTAQFFAAKASVGFATSVRPCRVGTHIQFLMDFRINLNGPSFCDLQDRAQAFDQVQTHHSNRHSTF